jgi:antitoxin Phd
MRSGREAGARKDVGSSKTQRRASAKWCGAREDGPQRVTVRGHDAVVVISVEQFDRLAPEKPKAGFLEFMESLHLGGLDLEREPDRGRDVEV